MKTLFLASVVTAIAGAGFVILAFTANATAPCEEMLKQLRAAKQTVKLSDADMTKVTDLETKGVDRCNADDDARADKFFAEAMKLMGK
jgi:hypothetical protein